MKIFLGSSKESLSFLNEISIVVEDNGLIPLRWDDVSTFPPGEFTLETLLKKTRQVHGAIFLFSEDDKTWYRNELQMTPRDNLLIEYGLFAGILGRERAIIIVDGNPKTASDLHGLNTIQLNHGKERAKAALRSWCQSLTKEVAINKTFINPTINTGPIRVYPNFEAASPDLKRACYEAYDIKILANKGFAFFGTDYSIVSTDKLSRFKNLRKLRVLLLSPNARWITTGLIAERKYGSVEEYKKEFRANQNIVELGFNKFSKILSNNRSGLRYYDGEPYWRMLITDQYAFVASYADDPRTQIKDLPVACYKNAPKSFYNVFKRIFNDIWHNSSYPAQISFRKIDFSESAGGIVYICHNECIFIALLKRSDGFWVLPKGHLDKSKDSSIEDAALREISEELGLPLSKLILKERLGQYEDHSYKQEGESKIVHIFSVQYTGNIDDTLHPDVDHAKGIWWDLRKELPKMLYVQQENMILKFKEKYKCT